MKICFNTFHPADSFFFLICNFTLFLLINFSLCILWIKIDKFSLWKCLVLCLISSQERVEKHKLYLIFSTKSTLKSKLAKNIFHLEIELNQVFGSALPYWQLLWQISEMQLCMQLYVHTWKIIPYLEVNLSLLKTKNSNSLMFIGVIIKLTIFLVSRLVFF